MLPIALRFSLVIALVVLLSVAVTSALNLLKFEQINDRFEESRYGFVARDIKYVLEENLNLGLPLDGIENVEEILQRQIELDGGISGVAIFDDDGRVLYEAARAPGSQVGSILEGSRLTGRLVRDRYAASVVINAFGQTAGGVLVRYSESERDKQRTAIAEAMSLSILAAAAIGVLIVWLGSGRLIAPLRKRLLSSAERLRKAGQNQGSQARSDTGFEGLAQRALGELREMEREIDRLAEAQGTQPRAADSEPVGSR